MKSLKVALGQQRSNRPALDACPLYPRQQKCIRPEYPWFLILPIAEAVEKLVQWIA